MMWSLRYARVWRLDSSSPYHVLMLDRPLLCSHLLIPWPVCTDANDTPRNNDTGTNTKVHVEDSTIVRRTIAKAQPVSVPGLGNLSHRFQRKIWRGQVQLSPDPHRAPCLLQRWLRHLFDVPQLVRRTCSPDLVCHPHSPRNRRPRHCYRNSSLRLVSMNHTHINNHTNGLSVNLKRIKTTIGRLVFRYNKTTC